MRHRTGLVLSVWVLAGAAGCVSADRRARPVVDLPAPKFEGMGTHTRSVTTESPEAQRFFNQGLVWAYAFNHDEAIRSFRTAAQQDPGCAMAWWGVALCNGPHINNPVVDEAHARAAWEALEKAKMRADGASPVERDLIAALGRRCADPQPNDRRPLDEAYATAMETVWKEYPNDPDVGTLYAESLMDLQPWDLWTKDGRPKGRVNEVLTVLEMVLEMDSNHPGANHLYIHATEASAHPEKGAASADRLRNAVPMSGHLTHMPSHIDVQLGRWSQAADQNVKAIESDRRYRAISPNQGFYRVYMAHDHHFLAFACMMEGRYERAMQAARDMIASVPPEYIQENAPWIDPYMMVALDVMKRFGRWDDILKEPKPPKELPITTAWWYFSRAVAHAAKGEVKEAEGEQKAFRTAVSKIPQDAVMAINPAHKVLTITEHFLEGEIAYRKGEMDRSVAAMRKAIAVEDDLLYMEPPEWIQPARHTLGAFLVSEGRWAEAEAVYKEDLEIWPENGWSLHGLSQCLHAQGKTDEAMAVQERFAKAWKRSDTNIGTSCMCVPEVAAR